ncbi:MAG TPA: DUF2892 domain-containing protein [Azospirillum sp.]|nr:DUF2892 domain-containing protein [Azospirillum sp.]
MSVETMIRDTYDQVFGGEQNMSTMERVASSGFGLIVAAAGVNRAGLSGALMGLAGAALVARGMSGHCPFKAMMEDGHAIGHGGHQNYVDHEEQPQSHPAVERHTPAI